MAKWTEDGWELLESIALNAYVFTGFKASASKVMEDAIRVCNIIEANPRIGNHIKNIFEEERFWHPFHGGKILIWKEGPEGIIFVGAFYFLPLELFV